MKDLINTIIAMVVSGALFFGCGYGLKELHYIVKKETLKQISKGLSSSEELANALTGKRLNY